MIGQDPPGQQRRDPFLKIDLGACCACGKQDETVRNLIMLPEKAPVEGTGWGCSVCGLASDGAMAVICDRCLLNKVEIRWAINGYATGCERIERGQLVGLHEHDQALHEAEDRRRGRELLDEYAARKMSNNGHKPKHIRVKSKRRMAHR